MTVFRKPINIPELCNLIICKLFVCRGIPVVSKNRKERFEAIAKYLQESSHTIVCLQEVWSEFDYLNLKDSLKGVLPYSHYFYR